MNVRQIIQTIVAEGKHVGPDAVTEELLRRVTSQKDQAAGFVDTARIVVHHDLVQSRGRGSGGGGKGSGGGKGRKPGRSLKRDLLLQLRLREPCYAGDHEWKQRAHMRFDNFMYSGDKKHAIGDATKAAGDRDYSDAALLKEHDVDMFGDLPEHVQRAALGLEGNAS